MNHSEHDRIAIKAYDLWTAEGHPHGRDRDHWFAAETMIALDDSAAAAPRETIATTSVETPVLAVTGDVLAFVGPKPAVTAPPVRKAAAKRAVVDGAKTEEVAPKRKAPVRAKAPAKAKPEKK